MTENSQPILGQDYFDRKFREADEANAVRDANLTAKLKIFEEHVEGLKLKQRVLEEDNLNLRFEIQRLRNDVGYMMGKESACKLVIENCAPEDGEDSEDKIRNRVLHIFKRCSINIEPQQIVAAKRVGKLIPGKIQRIIIKLSEPSLKKVIFPAAKKLKQMFNIYINNDYTPPQREERFHIRTTRRLLTQNNIDCYVRGFNIYINDVPHNWEAAQRLLKELKIPDKPTRDAICPELPNASSNTKRKNISPVDNDGKKKKKKPTKGRNTRNSTILRPPSLSLLFQSQSADQLVDDAGDDMDLEMEPSQPMDNSP